jgi:hypothetical protein
MCPHVHMGSVAQDARLGEPSFARLVGSVEAGVGEVVRGTAGAARWPR